MDAVVDGSVVELGPGRCLALRQAMAAWPVALAVQAPALEAGIPDRPAPIAGR